MKQPVIIGGQNGTVVDANKDDVEVMTVTNGKAVDFVAHGYTFTFPAANANDAIRSLQIEGSDDLIVLGEVSFAGFGGDASVVRPLPKPLHVPASKKIIMRARIGASAIAARGVSLTLYGERV
jgi:hypothetical protein